MIMFNAKIGKSNPRDKRQRQVRVPERPPRQMRLHIWLNTCIQGRKISQILKEIKQISEYKYIFN